MSASPLRKVGPYIVPLSHALVWAEGDSKYWLFCKCIHCASVCSVSGLGCDSDLQIPVTLHVHSESLLMLISNGYVQNQILNLFFQLFFSPHFSTIRTGTTKYLVLDSQSFPSPFLFPPRGFPVTVRVRSEKSK